MYFGRILHPISCTQFILSPAESLATFKLVSKTPLVILLGEGSQGSVLTSVLRQQATVGERDETDTRWYEPGRGGEERRCCVHGTPLNVVASLAVSTSEPLATSLPPTSKLVHLQYYTTPVCLLL